MQFLILFYLWITKYITNIYNQFRRLITDTKSVHVIKYKENKLTNVIYNYYVLRIIYYFMYHLSIFKKYFDYKVDLVHIVKDTLEGDKYILTTKIEYLSDIIDYVNKKKTNKFMTSCIVPKFYINVGENQEICLKKYLFNYSDPKEEHDHTLSNILKVNNIINIQDNSKVTFIKYINKVKKEYNFDYKNIADNHISYFSKLC